MKVNRWIDHLPPWLAWGALVSTGVHDPGEALAMALPLLAAALAEARGWSMGRWRRPLEIGALAIFLIQVVARAGLLPTVTNTLFVLCGARLMLPRELPQRRQILLMGFLLFLTTSIATIDLDFLLWSVLWTAGAALALLQQTWEGSASLRPGPIQRPPYARVLPWTAAALAMAAGFFVILPRLRAGFRPVPTGLSGASGSLAGLTDTLDLGGRGPIQGGGEVALRVVPGPGQDPEALKGSLALLRGYALEELDGSRWVAAPSTPRRAGLGWSSFPASSRILKADLYPAPGLRGLVPIPYGQTFLEAPGGESLFPGPGASVRWMAPNARGAALHLSLLPGDRQEPERPPQGTRLARLTDPGQEREVALRWSLRAAPGELPPSRLAERLQAALGTFRYTLDNPSGPAPDPLEDFLERTRAGHCEYFASAMGLALRARGVPARVVNGFRLGPWIQEGGYFLVTQNEAHAWVEYYDPDPGAWRVADPTPAAPAGALGTSTVAAAFARWSDAIRFRWDRHVVRFSDQDQMGALDWARSRLESFRAPRLSGSWTALALPLLAAAWYLRRRRSHARPGFPRLPGAIAELKPLVRHAGRWVPPRGGETARAWLDRLSRHWPARVQSLDRLAREVDRVAYGSRPGARLKGLAKEEAKAWRRAPGTRP